VAKTSLFSTIGSVLDDALRDAGVALRLGEGEVIEAVQAHLQKNSAAYYDGKPVSLPYDDPLCRIAYIYTYVAAHAYLLEYALAHFAATRELIASRLDAEGGALEICSLGGGPGSELLGLVRHIEERAEEGASAAVTFCVVDRVAAWADSWRALVLGIEADMKQRFGPRRGNWPVTVSHEFQPLDLRAPASLTDYPSRFGNVDLFVVNHVVSELKGSEEALGAWLGALANRSREGALFLVMDRNEAGMAAVIEKMLSSTGLAVVDRYEGKVPMPIDEEKSDLGATWQKFGRRPPKLSSDVTMALAVNEQVPF
jgi:hypothetical protein